MDQQDLTALGISQTPAELAGSLANLTHQCGLDGIVCSAQEASAMRTSFSDDFLLVTPGIRPAGSASDDQRRIMTPVDAINCFLGTGIDVLAIGNYLVEKNDV